MTEEEEARLVNVAIAGDLRALESLILAHHDEVLSQLREAMPPWLARLLDPEDLLQEAAVDLFRGIRDFKPHGPGSFLRWFVAAVMTRLSYETRGRPPGPRPPALFPPPWPELPPFESHAEPDVKAEAQRVVQEAMGRLPA